MILLHVHDLCHLLVVLLRQTRALSLERRSVNNETGRDFDCHRQTKLLWHVLEPPLPVEVSRLVALNCVMMFFGFGERRNVGSPVAPNSVPSTHTTSVHQLIHNFQLKHKITTATTELETQAKHRL